jgi:hypothetical protein
MVKGFTLVVGVAMLVIATGGTARAQSLPDFLFDHIWIRQSLKDKNTLSEPGFIHLTFPSEGADTREVAFAGSIFRKPASKDPGFNYGFGAQFNENTASGARVNTFVAAGESVWVSAAEPGDLYSRIKATAGFKRNGEKHTKGITANAYWSLEESRIDSEPTGGIPIGRLLEWTPQAGIEYENAIAATAASDEGYVGRAMLGLAVDLYPLPETLRKRVIVSTDLAYRRDLATSFENVDRDHPFTKLSIALAFDSLKIFSLALDQVWGEDPSQDFNGPSFTRLTFRVLFTKPQKRAYFFRTRSLTQLRCC